MKGTGVLFPARRCPCAPGIYRFPGGGCSGGCPGWQIHFSSVFRKKWGDAITSPRARQSIVGLPIAKFWSLPLGDVGGCRSACSIGLSATVMYASVVHGVGGTKSATGGHGSHPMMVHLHRFAPINKEEGILRWGLCPHAPGRPLSRFPLRGQAGAGRVPPTPQARAAPASSQSKRSPSQCVAGTSRAGGSPHKRGCRPPCASPRWVECQTEGDLFSPAHRQRPPSRVHINPRQLLFTPGRSARHQPRAVVQRQLQRMDPLLLIQHHRTGATVPRVCPRSRYGSAAAAIKIFKCEFSSCRRHRR